jgi:hypothetical protein
LIRIAITPAAFDAIAATLPLGSVTFEQQLGANGERFIWLEGRILNKLAAERRRGESYSDVILRLVEIEAGRRP